MKARPLLWAFSLLATGSAALAGDDPVLQKARAQAAQVVAIAKAAPLLCPGIEADDQAVQALMDHSQLTVRDIEDPHRFGEDDAAAARSFAQSVREDADYCSKVFGYLGDRGIRLLRRKPGGPG